MYAKGCAVERCLNLADRDAWIPMTANAHTLWATVDANVCLDHFLEWKARPLVDDQAAAA